jgi:hypothetical protein
MQTGQQNSHKYQFHTARVTRPNVGIQMEQVCKVHSLLPHRRS